MLIVMAPRTHAASRALIHDADCGFCTRAANWIAAKGNAAIRSWQSLPALSDYGLTRRMVAEAAYWINEHEPVAAGADATARSRIARGGIWKLVGWFALSPPANWVAKPIYRVIARYRHVMAGGTTACQLSQ